MVRLIPWLVVCCLTAVFATPLAQVLCERETETILCKTSDCGDSGCEDGAMPECCVNCGYFGKMVIAAISTTVPFRSATTLKHFASDKELPEGVSPSIDQPPREA